MPVQIICKSHAVPIKTRAVRGSDCSPAIMLSEEKDKFVTENWRERKIEQISSSSLISVYIIYASIVHMYTKFQLSRPHSSWEKCDKNCNVWSLEWKKYEKIKGLVSGSYWFWYTRYIHPMSTSVPSLKLLELTVPEKNVAQIWFFLTLEREKTEEITDK